MRTNVYVDGFNLYYGAVRNTPYRWLDIGKMLQRATHLVNDAHKGGFDVVVLMTNDSKW